jgi:hypothetical protein
MRIMTSMILTNILTMISKKNKRKRLFKILLIMIKKKTMNSNISKSNLLKKTNYQKKVLPSTSL